MPKGKTYSREIKYGVVKYALYPYDLDLDQLRVRFDVPELSGATVSRWIKQFEKQGDEVATRVWVRNDEPDTLSEVQELRVLESLKISPQMGIAELREIHRQRGTDCSQRAIRRVLRQLHPEIKEEISHVQRHIANLEFIRRVNKGQASLDML